MDVLEVPVTLIVKAPNQQVEDQTIHCNLSWTIKRLKGYLSEVYPSKPNTEDQRLIYYGQLLSDSVTLKDVFTRYEAGEETHTVHLVCMPSKETLRRRPVMVDNPEERPVQPEAAPSNERLAEEAGAAPPQRGAYPSGMPPMPNPADASSYMQHLAWMQRMYAQHYMNQYMDMMARQHGLPGLQEGYLAARQRFGQDGEAEQEAGQPAAPHPPPAPMDDDPEGIPENRQHRDWLDYFYMLSRVMVLLSFVIFYSSPARFIIVLTLGIIIYMYQIGFFRLHPGQGLENANEPFNNNVPAENNNMGEPPPATDPTDASAPPEAPGVPERPSFMAVTWTFFTSFFASLIPDAQNAI